MKKAGSCQEGGRSVQWRGTTESCHESCQESCHEYCHESCNESRSWTSCGSVDKYSRGVLSLANVHSKCTQRCCMLLLLVVCIVLTGTANIIIYKVMYGEFGESKAYFVSQGVNFLYIIFSIPFLFPIKGWGGDNWLDIVSTLSQHKHFIAIGFMDSCGTFLAAIGAVKTPGHLQTLLNQSLIPLIMLLSTTTLRARYGRAEVSAAAIILIGAVITLLPNTFTSTVSSSSISSTEFSGDSSGANSTQFSWTAVCIYFASNIPMAFSSVYKQHMFSLEVPILILSFWISIYQFIAGFILAPLLLLSSYNGVWTISSNFIGGLVLYTSSLVPFVLLTGYCIINFALNMQALALIKTGSATFCSLTNSLVLPTATVAFSLPIMGRHREIVSPLNYVALVVVVAGILLYSFGKSTKMHNFSSKIEDEIFSTAATCRSVTNSPYSHMRHLGDTPEEFYVHMEEEEEKDASVSALDRPGRGSWNGVFGVFGGGGQKVKRLKHGDLEFVEPILMLHERILLMDLGPSLFES